MASSQTSPLPRQSSSLCSPISNIFSDLQSDPSRIFSPMSMDVNDLLKSIYSDNNPNPRHNSNQNPNHNLQPPLLHRHGNRTVDEVWMEMVARGSSDPMQGGAGDATGDRTGRMTLEDFLTEARAVTEEDVRAVPVVVAPGGCAVDLTVPVGTDTQFLVPTRGGRGKRRAVEEEPEVDKATQQQQRRMIKNRESASRSRERKQAYTVELESLVTQLEEENACLLREEAEHNKERLKQLKESLIPVVEKQGQVLVLRRVHSLQW